MEQDESDNQSIASKWSIKSNARTVYCENFDEDDEFNPLTSQEKFAIRNADLDKRFSKNPFNK